MRVAIIPPTGQTGEWTLNQHLIPGLRAHNVDVRVLHHFALNRPHTKVLLGSLLLKRLIKDGPISLIHNVDNLGPFLFRHRNLPAKKVLTVHDIAPAMVPACYTRILPDHTLRFDFAIVLPKLIENCDLIIVPSHSTMTDLIAKFEVPKDKLTVVHLGVDTSFFHPHSDYSRVMRKYDLRRSYLLYVGDDGSRKNLKTLIRAYVSVFQEIPDDLVLIGPINENKIRGYINSSDLPSHVKKEAQRRITVLGYVAYEDLPRIYSAATALIFPSLYEGFGLPPLEAMACNAPVVLSDNSSLREVAGDAGLYIHDPLNSADISGKILEIITDESLRENLRSKGSTQAHRFSWETTVQKTINAYDSIL
ncbi:MAG: glycosyltransferase family 1 protein [Halobacteriota archaeon]